MVVHAAEESEARQRAEQIGRDGEHEYFVDSPERHTLRWRFRGIERVYEILSDTLGDGVEVFSRFLGSDEAQLLLKR